MQKSLAHILALLATVAASALCAQPAAVRTASLGGVSFAVPPQFTLVPALSDGAAAVYAHAPTRTWLFVATVENAEQRRSVMRRLGDAIAAEAFGAAGDRAEWQTVPSDPASSLEDFRQRLVLVGAHRSLDVTFRQYRSGGRDVLAGSAFALDDAKEPLALCGETSSVPASQAEAQLTASLGGRPADPASLLNGFVERASGEGGPGSPPPPDREVERVREVFHAYLKALLEHDGAAAAALAVPAVVEHYNDLLRLALHASPEEVRSLPLLDRFEVLHLRHREDAAKLPGMHPQEVLASEMVSMEVDGSAESTPPVVRGDIAWVNLTWKGEPTPERIFFVRRNQVWRVDFLSMLATGACELRRDMRAHGVGPQDENGMLLMGLEGSTGRAPSTDIWLPLVRSGSGHE